MRSSAWIVAIVLVFMSAACQKSQQSLDGNSRGSMSANSDGAPNTAVMTVHGMACPQCAYNVDLQLLKVPGVQGVKVDMKDGKVIAELSAQNPPTRDQLAQAIENTGFTLVDIQMK